MGQLTIERTASERYSTNAAAGATVGDMAQQVTLTLPDDVVELLAKKDDPSAFVAELVRGRMMGEVVREQLRAAGFAITDEGVAEARAEIERLRKSITPETRAKAAELYAEVMRMRAGFRG